MRRLVRLLVLLAAAASGAAAADHRPVPRTILALYDGQLDSDIRFTAIHKVFEMPLNHLGLVVAYHDLRQPLPTGAALDDVRGVLVWFLGDVMPNPLPFIEWTHGVIDSGRKLVMVGSLGMANDRRGKATELEAINGLLRRIGLRYDEKRVEFTQDVRVVRKDRSILDFEVELPRQLPRYDRIVKIDPRVQSHLIVREGADASTDATLVSTHPAGGMVVGDYVHRGDYATPHKRLYLNTFEFLRRAFATDDLPKPDTTTLVGRRIYYSHIDGDGWRSLSQVRKYGQKRMPAAEVVLREAIAPFPDLPVTVAPIVADLDPEWFGSEEFQAIARELFDLPQVEIGTHTFSHPFDWGFFADDDPTRELPLLRRYPRRPGGNDDDAWAPVVRRASAQRDRPAQAYDGKVVGSEGSYTVPRAYAVRPFDLKTEVEGSIAFLNRLAPPGKQVALLQWSGNCQPWEAAVAATYGAGILNMNGGDTRFDREYPSYTSVAAIGRKLPGAIQIYASNANENLYTDLWSDRFFGFALLPLTWRNTETPIRVKPKNLYYHMYSGERQASLTALIRNLKEAEAEPIAPLAASEFARLALGFYSARITDLGSERWRVEDRGTLGTLRFDRAIDREVDFSRSVGVLGQTHHQGSLYVALDPAEASPVIALAAADRTDEPPDAPRAYLIESRWPIEGLELDGRAFSFRARGFGPGEMVWKVPEPGRYQIVAEHGDRVVESFAEVGADGLLAFVLRMRTDAVVSVAVRRIRGS